MNANQQFVKLLEPGKIGTMTVRNRMVMPAMSSARGSQEGYVTQQSIDHWEARARGGFGLVTTEFVCVDAPEGRAGDRQLIIDNDRFIPGLKKLTKAIQKHGAKAAIQLQHAGRSARSTITLRQPVGPSPVAAPGGEVPRELSEADIARLVTKFTEAAIRAREAGFDGIEIHGAHAYLLAQFLSVNANRRQDRYGGSLENRARFLTEVLRAIRKELGRAFPVWCRLSLETGCGITIDEMKQVARMAQNAGADAIHLSTLWDGGVLPLAAAVKSTVSIPVIASSCIDLPSGENALQQGKVDFISLGRPSLADPELPNKLTSGEPDDVVPCLYCGSHTSAGRPDGWRCSVNPMLGREGEYQFTKARKKKRVVVIGGGPAGMEAARIAALRGHKVKLYEKASELGGQLLLAKLPPEKQHITELISYLAGQMDKRGVEVHLSTEATADLIAKESPDAVVVATGATPFIPDIPGIKGRNVVQANDVLTGKAKTGKNVFIIGGELVGCEVADFLTDAGKKATPSTLLPQMATQTVAWYRTRLLNRLTAKGVDMSLTGVKSYKEITPKGATIIEKDGKERFIEADTIVVAAGSKPNAGLLSAIVEKETEVYPVGDCIRARNILESMNEGYRAALSI